MKTTKTTLLMICAVTTASLVAAAPIEARVHRHRAPYRPSQEEYTQRGLQFYAGFGGQGYEIEDDDYQYLDEHSSDGMFFLGAAVGLGRNVSLYLEGAGSEHETDIGDLAFGYTHIGLKYAPGAGRGRSWQPYGKVSAGAMFLLEEDAHGGCGCRDDDNGYIGPSFALGVGIDKFVSRHVALYGEVGMLMGRFNTRIVDGHDHELADEIGVSSARLQLGIRLRL
jgi:hypothetical protein